MSQIEGPADVIECLAAAGITTVEDVLAAAECTRDLPDRSNHILRSGGLVIHVKRRKGASEPREALALERMRAAGVPTATPAFDGVDPVHGALSATLDLAPAQPLDDLLRRGLSAEQRSAAFETLAGVIARIHDADLHHRDLYLCHVFMRFEGTSAVAAVIDLERAGTHRHPLGRRVVKDLAAIRSSVPPGTTSAQERLRFLERYLELRGIPREAQLKRLHRRVARKARRIRARVPKTPVGEAARPQDRSA